MEKSHCVFMLLFFLCVITFAQQDSSKAKQKDYSKLFKSTIHKKGGKRYGDDIVFSGNCNDGGKKCTCINRYKNDKIIRSTCYRDGQLISEEKKQFIVIFLKEGTKIKTWAESGRKRGWSATRVHIRGRSHGRWPNNQKRISVTWSHERGKGIHRSRSVTKANPY